MEDRIPVNNIDIKYSDLTTSYVSKFVKIVDIESNKILCMGKVINVKLNYPCISLDNKHFFKILPNQKYKIEIIEDSDLCYNYPIKQFPDNYIIDQWCYFDNNQGTIISGRIIADLYIENTINDVDLEIKDLVDILNNIADLKTCTSCCGHLKDHAYVTFEVTSIKPLIFLGSIISEYFQDTWELVTNYHTFNHSKAAKFVISLNCLIVGEKSYDLINKLVLLIKEKLHEEITTNVV